MIDFSKSNLFDRERTKFRKFIDNKLFTPDEYASRIETSDTTQNNVELIDTQSFLGGSPIDFLGGGDEGDYENMWGGGDEEGERKRHVDISNERMHETGVWWKDILYAPFFLVVYVFKSLIYDFPTKEEWKSIAVGVQKVSAVTCVISAILWILGFKFIFTLQFQTIAAGLLFGLATSTIKVLEKNGTSSENGDESASGSDFDFGSGDNDFDFGALGTDDEAINLDGANLSMPTTSMNFNVDNLFATPESDKIVETVNTGKYKILAPSPIVIDSKDDFERSLMEVFIQNERYRGVEIQNRKELIESLHGYIVTNDKNFGSWSIAQPRSIEYNNVAYALFKGLGQIQNSFLTDEEAMVIMNIKSNPLLYKIEVELPNYFKLAQVKSKIREIEDALRNGESDTNVQVFVSYYQGIFVFKFLRLDNNNLISLGDILRFYDEDKGGTALDSYANPKMGLPILIGLQNNEYPYVVDLEANTSGVIVGGSGSGKSWFTFLVLFNFILTNDYNNINFVVFDKKNAAFWNQFAKFPHVFGYHTDIEYYLEQMRELYQEVDRRKKLLVQLNEENIKGYRQRLREDGEYEKLKEVPNLIIIVDEITSTMQDLESMYLERDEIQYYKEYRNILAMISQEGRSLGVRLIVIGQRAIDNSVPKNVIANSSFKFAMKMDAESDFEIMLGKEVSSMPKPQAMGLGIVKTMGGGLQSLKTLTVGGANEYQILRLIRVLALEWVRRSDGLDDILNMPKSLNLPKCYNRNKFVQESLIELEEWRILSPTEVTAYKPNASGMGGSGDMRSLFNAPSSNPLPTVETPAAPAFDFDFDTEESVPNPVTPAAPAFDFDFDMEEPMSNPVTPATPNFDFDFDMEEPMSNPVTPATPNFDFDFDTEEPTSNPVTPVAPNFDFDFDMEEPMSNPEGNPSSSFDFGFNFDVAEPTATTEVEATPRLEEHTAAPVTPVQPKPSNTAMKLAEFETMVQSKPPVQSNLNALTVKLKVYGHILNFGEKIQSGDVTQSRIHKDVLTAKFTEAELEIGATHTNVRVDGDYYYAWRK